MASAQAQKQTRIGYVDMNVVLNKNNNYKASQKILDEKIKPIIIEKHNRDEPPFVKNGSGKPTTGIKPLTINIFKRKLKPITKVKYVPR